MKNPCIFLILLIFSLSVRAQHQDHIWIFGESAGLNFTSGTPVPFTGNVMSAGEGCASVSDEFGQLYFYTNGITVWNRNHEPMVNGTGLTGHLSATNSAVVVPVPNSSSLYYVFTTGAADNNFADGLNYSIVDMCKENGLGAITSKNISLEPLMSEKLSVIRDKNSQTIWLVGHKMFSNEFFSYKITAAGIDPIPVISAVGISLDVADAARGEMKASSSGNKIAMPYRPSRSLYLFDFDRSTGIVSNPISWNFAQGGLLYGAEFSQDEQKLYATRYGAGSGAAVHQFDISSGNPTTISSSGLIVGTSSSTHMASLKLGPDNKIYIARQEFYGTGGGAQNGGSEYLAIIHSPNNLGQSCNFEDDGIFFAGGRSRFGLPPTVTIFPASQGNAQIVANPSCVGSPSGFSIIFSTPSPSSVIWNFGDPSSGNANTIKGFSASHTYYQPGAYTVTATYVINCKPTTVSTIISIISGSPISLGNDFFLCSGIDTTLIVNNNPGTTYLWNTGSIDTAIIISQAGLYWISANNGSCISSDSIIVNEKPFPQSYFGSDTTICATESLQLTVEQLPEHSYLWSTGEISNSVSVSAPGNYFVEVETNGCRSTYSINVNVDICEFFVPNVFTPNNDNINDNFTIRGLRKDPWQLKIFNRYGYEIYSSSDYKNDWDGNSSPNGVYYYYLTNTVTSKSYKGYVVILE